MANTLHKLIAILEKSGLQIDKTHQNTLKITDGFHAIFRSLLPSRCCEYDTEVIDDANGYIQVLHAHMAATSHEWTVEHLAVTEEPDAKIRIEFIFKDQNSTWQFEQNGSDYVSEGFYRCLHNWVSANLSGTFLELQTGGQDAAFVYLPNTITGAVHDFMGTAYDIDAYVDTFRKGQEIPEEFYSLREDPSFDTSARDSLGETALTAAIQSGNHEMALSIIKLELCNLTSKNAQGLTPLQLARVSKASDIVGELESQLIFPSETWDDIQWFYADDPDDDDNVRVMELMEAIHSSQHLKQIFFCAPLFWSFYFARTPNIELGHETLNIKIIHEDQRKEPDLPFFIHYSSKDNPGKDYTLTSASLDEALASVHDFYSL